jgi:hypothetical protein
MLNRVCLAAVLSLSVFCVQAKPADVPMPVAGELQVELVESQQEIAVTVPQTASAVGMQFGLIGALIGSAVQNSQAKNAEEAVVPLRNLLVDYRFNQRMHDALLPKLASPGLSPNPTLTVMATAWDAHDAQQAAKLPPYALVLVPSYAMDSDFAQLTVSLRAQVVDRTVKSNGKIKAVPRVGHTYSFQFPLQGVRSEDPVQDWVVLGAAGLAQLLDQGIAQTTDMLVQDFSDEGRSWWNVKPKGGAVTVDGNVYEGQPVREGEGWAWVRKGKGPFQVMQGYQPLKVGVPVAAPAPAAAVAQATAVSEAAAADVDAATDPVTVEVAAVEAPATGTAVESPAVPAAATPEAPAAAPEPAPVPEAAPAAAPIGV